MRTRLLVICELLLIIAWVYLLFQWHPDATALTPFVTPQANIRYAALRTDISRQLQAANEHPPTLAFANDSNTSFGLDAIFDRTEDASPVPSSPPVSFGTINNRPMSYTPENITDAERNTNSSTGVGRNARSAATSPSTTANPVPATAPSSSTMSTLAPAPPPACPYRLSTIIRGTGRSTVVLVNTATNESLFVTTGQKAGDWLVTDIGSDSITVRSSHGDKTLWIE